MGKVAILAYYSRETNQHLMKSKILISMIFASVFFVACSTPAPSEAVKNPNEQKSSSTTQMSQSLKDGSTISEIDNPKLTLPADINDGQIKKYFKVDNDLYALVLRNSGNVVLTLPKDFVPSFAGVLTAKQGETKWTKLAEIKDEKTTDKNNPYYLIIDNKKLLLTVVDQNGAGSGEGKMKVFAFTETRNWKMEGCYYFGARYSDASTDGDYFAFSAKFSEQEAQAIESCENVQLISAEKQPVIKQPVKDEAAVNNESEAAKNTLITFFDYLSENEFEKAISLTDLDDSSFWDTVKIYDRGFNDKVKMLEAYCEATQTCLKAKVLKVQQVTNAEYILTTQFTNKDGSVYAPGPCCGAEEDTPPKSEFDFTVKKINNIFKVTTAPLYRP